MNIFLFLLHSAFSLINPLRDRAASRFMVHGLWLFYGLRCKRCILCRNMGSHKGTFLFTALVNLGQVPPRCIAKSLKISTETLALHLSAFGIEPSLHVSSIPLCWNFVLLIFFSLSPPTSSTPFADNRMGWGSWFVLSYLATDRGTRRHCLPGIGNCLLLSVNGFFLSCLLSLLFLSFHF